MDAGCGRIYLNRLLAGPDGYLFLAAVALPIVMWQEAPGAPLGSEFAIGVTAICLVFVIARLVYLRRTVTEGRRVLGRVLDMTNTGRFHVAYEVDGTSYETRLSYARLRRREAARMTEVFLLVDPRRPQNAIIIEALGPDAVS